MIFLGAITLIFMWLTIYFGDKSNDLEKDVKFLSKVAEENEELIFDQYNYVITLERRLLELEAKLANSSELQYESSMIKYLKTHE
jgi:hypothetical protein